MCYKMCSPCGNERILHRHEHKNETLFHLSVTQMHFEKLKREVNRIILILILCLQACKDKVTSPSLPSASTATYNKTVA